MILPNNYHDPASSLSSPIYRFTSEADTGWFTRTMTRVVAEDLGETYLPLLEPTHFFVDFLK